MDSVLCQRDAAKHWRLAKFGIMYMLQARPHHTSPPPPEKDGDESKSGSKSEGQAIPKSRQVKTGDVKELRKRLTRLEQMRDQRGNESKTVTLATKRIEAKVKSSQGVAVAAASGERISHDLDQEIADVESELETLLAIREETHPRSKSTAFSQSNLKLSNATSKQAASKVSVSASASATLSSAHPMTAHLQRDRRESTLRLITGLKCSTVVMMLVVVSVILTVVDLALSLGEKKLVGAGGLATNATAGGAVNGTAGGAVGGDIATGGALKAKTKEFALDAIHLVTLPIPLLQLIFSFLLAVEVFVHIWARGFCKFMKRPLCVMDLLVTLMDIASLVVEYSGLEVGKFIGIVAVLRGTRLIRILRLVRVARKIKQMQLLASGKVRGGRVARERENERARTVNSGQCL